MTIRRFQIGDEVTIRYMPEYVGIVKCFSIGPDPTRSELGLTVRAMNGISPFRGHDLDGALPNNDLSGWWVNRGDAKLVIESENRNECNSYEDYSYDEEEEVIDDYGEDYDEDEFSDYREDCDCDSCRSERERRENL